MSDIWWIHQHAEEHQSFPRKRATLLYSHAHASELVIDRALGATMAREEEEKGRAKQRVAHFYKNKLFRR